MKNKTRKFKQLNKNEQQELMNFVVNAMMCSSTSDLVERLMDRYTDQDWDGHVECWEEVTGEDDEK